MMRTVLTVVLCLGMTYTLAAQQRYLYRYDYVTGGTDSIALTEATQWMKESTAWAQGSLPGRESLPIVMPPDNELEERTLPLRPAKGYISTLTYPARCAAALRVVRNDLTTGPSCSAVIVGSRWVLTAAHCVFNAEKPLVFKQREYRVYPAWDDGQLSTDVPFGRVIRAYFVGGSPAYILGNDLALLELDNAVGDVTGWVGLHTTPDTIWPSGALGHRLSYPAARSLVDTNRVFTGDTLYYRYGEVNRIRLRAYSNSAVGVLGESGASLLIANNGGYASVGVLSFANDLNTKLLDSTTFESFRDLMRGTIASTNYEGDAGGVADEHGRVTISPNPVDDVMNIHLIHNEGASIDAVDIYDIMGRCVVHTQATNVSCTGLAPGTYNVVVTAGARRYQTLVIKR